ncbi:hypothetical protein DFH08DRAFT_1087809 [Mycena albidolilacea]|uniref:Uncharacterized protein n=1 Tax=Mycena albidolilacea TaxID=1033008 RepID=A0AAD6Z886_9AGAR|nr:hypothetical protein DFH08DRAFT_1087809 [Mycena albidolilacea]
MRSSAPSKAYTMLLSIHFVSTAPIVLSTVNASPPQWRDNPATIRVGRAPTCPLGQYPDSTTYPGYRISSPAGKTRDGNGAADCDTGHAQPCGSSRVLVLGRAMMLLILIAPSR